MLGIVFCPCSALFCPQGSPGDCGLSGPLSHADRTGLQMTAQQSFHCSALFKAGDDGRKLPNIHLSVTVTAHSSLFFSCCPMPARPLRRSRPEIILNLFVCRAAHEFRDHLQFVFAAPRLKTFPQFILRYICVLCLLDLICFAKHFAFKSN